MLLNANMAEIQVLIQLSANTTRLERNSTRSWCDDIALSIDYD